MGAPLFKKATIHLENGKKFTIEAPDNSAENIYVNSLKLNRKPYTRNFITHSELMKGGRIEAKMTAEPNTKRGTKTEDRPYSLSNE